MFALGNCIILSSFIILDIGWRELSLLSLHDITEHRKEVNRRNICSYIPLPRQLVRHVWISGRLYHSKCC